MVGIREHGERAQARKGLREQLHSLAGDFEGQERDAGEVAAGTRQALRKACLDGIAADGEEDWNVLDGRRPPDRREAGHDQHDLRLAQFRSFSSESLGLSAGYVTSGWPV